MPNVTYQRPTDFLMIPQAQQNFYNIVIVHLTFFGQQRFCRPQIAKRFALWTFFACLGETRAQF